MTDVKFTKHTITNTSDGPKVVNAKVVGVLPAGESVDVELSEAELEAAKATGWFEFGAKAAAAAAKADDAK